MASDQAKLKKRLEALLKLPENQVCSDCGRRGPRWASANLGVFFCIECSGIHRNLGTHICFVRSVNLDTWTLKQVEFMESWGNKRANEYYEANLPANFSKPKETDSVRTVERFIRDKYELKRYIAKSVPPPNEDSQTEDDSPSPTKSKPVKGITSKSKVILASSPAPAPAAVPTPQIELNLLDMSDPIPPVPPAQANPVPAAQPNTFSQGFVDFGPPATFPVVPTAFPPQAPPNTMDPFFNQPNNPQQNFSQQQQQQPQQQQQQQPPKASADAILSLYNTQSVSAMPPPGTLYGHGGMHMMMGGGGGGPHMQMQMHGMPAFQQQQQYQQYQQQQFGNGGYHHPGVGGMSMPPPHMAPQPMGMPMQGYGGYPQGMGMTQMGSAYPQSGSGFGVGPSPMPQMSMQGQGSGQTAAVPGPFNGNGNPNPSDVMGYGSLHPQGPHTANMHMRTTVQGPHGQFPGGSAFGGAPNQMMPPPMTTPTQGGFPGSFVLR